MTDSTDPENLYRPKRQNRTVEDEAWIQDFLARSGAGVFSTIHDGQPFGHPNLFYYDLERGVIYLHTGRYGRTRDNITEEVRACFTVFEMGRLLPAEVITDYSTEYASVMVFGKVEIVTDLEEMRHALQAQVDKYFPHKLPHRDYLPFTEEEMLRTTVYRLDIENWSAKRNRAAEDYPEAFRFPGSGALG